MFAAVPPPVFCGDLPTDAEAKVQVKAWLAEADTYLAEAEIRRRVAVALGTELRRGEDGRGYVVDNRKNPPMDPPYIKWQSRMKATPYRALKYPPRSARWEEVDGEAQRLIEAALGLYSGTMAAGTYVAPNKQLCRVPDNALAKMRKQYNDVRSQMHAYARWANERRYALMFVLARVQYPIWADLARPIERFVPHRLTEGDAGDQTRGTERYQAWMKEICLRNGRIGAAIPEPGVAREFPYVMRNPANGPNGGNGEAPAAGENGEGGPAGAAGAVGAPGGVGGLAGEIAEDEEDEESEDDGEEGADGANGEHHL